MIGQLTLQLALQLPIASTDLLVESPQHLSEILVTGSYFDFRDAGANKSNARDILT